MSRQSGKSIFNRLTQYSSLLLKVGSLKELAGVVEQAIEVEISNAERTGLYLYDESSKRLVLWIAKGFSIEEFKKAQETAMSRHPGRVFREKIVIDMDDIPDSDNQRFGGGNASYIVRSRLFLPVVVDEKCVGAFGVTSSIPHSFNKATHEILAYICNTAALAYMQIDSRSKKEKLEEERRLLELAVRSTTNGLIVAEAKAPGRPIILCSPGFEKITGYSSAEVLGRSCNILQGPNTDPGQVESIRSALEKSEALQITIRNYKKDGTPFWNELKISPIKNSDGETTHFVGTQNDVTEKVNTSERLASVIQNFPGAILVEDRDRKIILSNRKFCDLFKIPATPEQIVGVDCEKAADSSKLLFHDEEGFLTGVSLILKERKLVQGEQLRLKDGHVLERDYVPIFSGGEYLGHLWHYTDVTERIRFQNELMALKSDADLANQAKGRFLANMSHEIRTPLNAVIGVIQILKETPLFDPEVQKWVRLADGASKTVLQIINDVLDMAKIEENKLLLESQPVDIEHCVKETVSMFEAHAQSKKIKLDIINENKNNFKVLTDELRLRQVVLNLVGNALKFSHAGGSIVVRLTQKRLAANKLETRISVQDNGPGIDAETLSRIFRPFEQGDQSTKKKFGGTGLGLSISKKIAIAFGGDIEAKSEPKKGSTFVLHFPADMSENETCSITTRAIAPVPNLFPLLKILLVDDIKENLMILERLLSGYGFEIQTAESGFEALERISQFKPDLIFLDVQMPEMDGFEVLSKLKNFELANVREPSFVIATTGFIYAEDVKRFRDAGFDGHLGKPIKKQKLLGCIEEFLRVRHSIVKVA